MTTSSNRQHHFNDKDFHKDPLVGSKIEQEIGSLSDLVNNLIKGVSQFTNLVFVAPDGKLFRLSVIYEPDGITPTLTLQRITFP